MAAIITQFSPFRTCDAALDNCTIDPGLKPNQKLSRNSWFLTAEDISDGFNPTIEINIDWDRFTEESEIHPEDVAVAIRHKNSDARLFKVLASWDGGDEDDLWAPDQILQLGASFDLALTIHSKRTINDEGQNILWPGSIIASNSIHCSKRGLGFPVEYANFEARNWPADAVFHVELDTDSINNPPEDCLTVYLNEKLKPMYDSSRREARAARDIFTHSAAAMIFSAVARNVLQAETSDVEEPSGLIEVVMTKLNSDSESTIDQWRQILNNSPDEFEQRAQDSLKSAQLIANSIR